MADLSLFYIFVEGGREWVGIHGQGQHVLGRYIRLDQLFIAMIRIESRPGIT